MARDLKPEYALATEESITAPLYLVELALEQRTYRACSFDTSIQVLDREWYDSNLVVTGPSQRSGGTLSATVSMPYRVSQAGGVLLDDILEARPQDRPAKLYKTYFHADAYLEPILLLDGVIDDASLRASGGGGNQRISFSIVSRGNRGGRTPFIRIAPPLLNHITAAGSVVIFNDGRYEIDR